MPILKTGGSWLIFNVWDRRRMYKNILIGFLYDYYSFVDIIKRFSPFLKFIVQIPLLSLVNKDFNTLCLKNKTHNFDHINQDYHCGPVLTIFHHHTFLKKVAKIVTFSKKVTWWNMEIKMLKRWQWKNFQNRPTIPQSHNQKSRVLFIVQTQCTGRVTKVAPKDFANF